MHKTSIFDVIRSCTRGVCARGVCFCSLAYSLPNIDVRAVIIEWIKYALSIDSSPFFTQTHRHVYNLRVCLCLLCNVNEKANVLFIHVGLEKSMHCSTPLSIVFGCAIVCFWMIEFPRLYLPLFFR